VEAAPECSWMFPSNSWIAAAICPGTDPESLEIPRAARWTFIRKPVDSMRQVSDSSRVRMKPKCEVRLSHCRWPSDHALMKSARPLGLNQLIAVAGSIFADTRSRNSINGPRLDGRTLACRISRRRALESAPAKARSSRLLNVSCVRPVIAMPPFDGPSSLGALFHSSRKSLSSCNSEAYRAVRAAPWALVSIALNRLS